MKMISIGRSLMVITILSTINKQCVDANLWRKSLQKELLLNSVVYLRRELFTCLKVTESGRGKRKVANVWYSDLRLQMDLDILKNSEDYLTTRVIECRMKLTSGQVVEDNSVLDRVLSSSPERCHNARSKSVVDVAHTTVYANNKLSSGYHTVGTPHGYHPDGAMPAGQRSDRLTPGYNTGKGSHSHDPEERHSGYDTDKGIPNSAADKLYSVYSTHSDISGHNVNEADATNNIENIRPTSPPSGKTQAKPVTQYDTTYESTTITTRKPDAKFILDGQYVTCDRAHTISNTFQCRNLRVNNGMRLPNMDYCPPNYDINRWRSMEDMSERTRDAVDLLDLCARIGQQLNVTGYTTDVRVVWECDKVTPRMKWQNGRWAGVIKDNGFLHDLECRYSTEI